IGSLVYIPASAEGPQRKLVWVDRHGTSQPLAVPPRPYAQPRVSPDGGRIIVQLEGVKNDLWAYDVARDIWTRLTFEGNNANPALTPDGKRVTYHSERARAQGLFTKAVDGSGMEDQLTSEQQSEGVVPQSWSPDEKLLAFHKMSRSTQRDIWLLPIDGE